MVARHSDAREGGGQYVIAVKGNQSKLAKATTSVSQDRQRTARRRWRSIEGLIAGSSIL